MNPRQNIVLLVACTAVLFEAMDIAIINLAMPLMQKQFNLESGKVLWLQTLYILPYGGFLILGGKLSDSYGRKRIFLLGTALFLLTSLGAGLSSDFKALAAFRTIQGLAAALVLPSALSIITNTFTESSARNKALGIFSSFAAVGSGLGLSVGGIMSTWAGWQWAFFINVPIIGISWLLGYLYIDNDERKHGTATPDLLSALLITSSIMALSYLVHDLNHISKNLLSLVLLTAWIAGCLWWFMKRSAALKEPLISFSLFNSRSTIIGNIVTLLLGAFFSGYLFILSILFQNNMNYSAAKAGLLLFPFSLLSAVTGKFLFPIILKRASILQAGILGMSLMATGALALILSVYAGYSLPVLLISVACVTGCGMAISFPSLMVMAISQTPSEHHGLASSLSSTAYFFGGGIGLSLLSLSMQLSESKNTISFPPILTLFFIALAGIVILMTVPHRSEEKRAIQSKSEL